MNKYINIKQAWQCAWNTAKRKLYTIRYDKRSHVQTRRVVGLGARESFDHRLCLNLEKGRRPAVQSVGKQRSSEEEERSEEFRRRVQTERALVQRNCNSGSRKRGCGKTHHSVDRTRCENSVEPPARVPNPNPTMPVPEAQMARGVGGRGAAMGSHPSQRPGAARRVLLPRHAARILHHAQIDAAAPPFSGMYGNDGRQGSIPPLT